MKPLKQKRLVPKVIAVVLSAILITIGTAGTAFAYTFINTSDVRYNYFSPLYLSYNQGAFTQMGYYFTDIYSFMHIACNSHQAAPGAITSQAGFTVNNMYGGSEMRWGPAVTHSGTLGAGSYLTATHESGIKYGEGASAWGYGVVRTDSGSTREVTSQEVYLTTLTDPGPIGPYGETPEEWMPEKDNFVGSDGLVYGVPYKNEEGKLTMPDMGRVTATNGEIGYIKIAEMDSTIYNGATTDEERAQAVADNADIETSAFQRAFAEYFGVDTLSYDAAYESIMKIRYKDGKEAAIAAIESDTQNELASAIKDGLVTNDKAMSVLGRPTTPESSTNSDALDLTTVAPSAISITEEVYDEILQISMEQMMVSVSVFAADGLAIIGQYEFARL